MPSQLHPETAAEASDDLRDRLLCAALTEFANYGYRGARLERIAESAGCAKRMLYYYFGNKREVYIAVLENAYRDIRRAERDLDLDRMEPRAALHALARQSFLYHERHRDFTRLILQENFQNGALVRELEKGEDLRRAALEPLDRLLRRGAEAGVFRPGIDAADVHFLISALSSFRVDHAHTWAELLRIDLLGAPLRERHLQLLLDQLDGLVVS